MGRRSCERFTVAGKQAFEEEDSANQPDEQQRDPRDKPKKHSQKEKVPETTYERSLFTVDNITVEVILNNDVVSWSTICNTSKRNYVIYRLTVSQLYVQ